MLPIEILHKTFAYLNSEDLVAVRLVSKLFYQVASESFLQNVTISLRHRSLDKLGDICQHPVLRKGVRQITFDLAQYDERAVLDKRVYGKRLLGQLRDEQMLQHERACDLHRKIRTFFILKKTCKHKPTCNPQMLYDLHYWVKVCKAFSKGSTRLIPLFPSRRRPHFLYRGYKRYCKLFLEQKEISASEAHVRAVKRALDCMPRIDSLRIVGSSSTGNRPCRLIEHGQDHPAFVLDPVNVFDDDHAASFGMENVIRAWEQAGLKLENFICHELKGLTQLFPAGHNTPLPPNTAPLFKHTTRMVIQIGFHLQDSDEHSRSIESLENNKLGTLLLHAEGLESLTMAGGLSALIHYPTPLEHLLPSSPWRNLRSLSIIFMSIGYPEFKALCARQQNTLLSLSFNQVILNHGEWMNLIEDIHVILALETVHVSSVLDDDHRSQSWGPSVWQSMESYILEGGQNPLAIHSVVSLLLPQS